MPDFALLWEKKGNDSADKYAKLGAKFHPWKEGAMRTHDARPHVVKELRFGLPRTRSG